MQSTGNWRARELLTGKEAAKEVSLSNRSAQAGLVMELGEAIGPALQHALHEWGKRRFLCTKFGPCSACVPWEEMSGLRCWGTNAAAAVSMAIGGW